MRVTSACRRGAAGLFAAVGAMSAGLPALGAQPSAAAGPVLCARDAAGRALVATAAWIAEGGGTTRVDAQGCVRPVGTVGRLRALGARPVALRLDTLPGDTLRITLVPVAQPLVRVRGIVPSGAALAAERTVAEARRAGATTAAQLVGAIPFVSARGARGDVAVSLRGARSEQTLVTLDGLALTDPATGAADLSDLPLVLLGRVTARPGADGAGAGLGAIGGVLALEAGRGSALAASHGAWGRRQLEGAWAIDRDARTVRVGAAWLEARDDFAVAVAPDIALAPTRERRVNNDRRRVALFAHGAGTASQWLVVGTRTTQGLVGPLGVRANDADRGTTSRALVRGARALGAATLAGGVRALRLDYADATRPVLDTRADVLSADLDGAWPARLGRWPLLVRGGIGHDAAWSAPRHAEGGAPRLAQARPRAWGALGLGGATLRADVRVDAVRGAPVTPSVSLAAARTLGGPWRGVARVGQALRVPTLYDLWFAAPQRVEARVLRPERVLADGELALRREGARLGLEGALVAREVRDAIVWFPGNFGWSPDNVGRERLHGLEGRAQARLARGAWRADADLWGHWLRAELRSGELTIPTPYVARRAGGGVLRVGRGRVDGALTWRAMGRRPFTRGPRNAAFELPAVTVADLAVGFAQPLHRWTARVVLAAENVGDARWEGVRGFPAPPRNWSLQVTLDPSTRR